MIPTGLLLPLLPKISRGHSIRVPTPALVPWRSIGLKMGTKWRGVTEGPWEGGTGALLAALSHSSQAPPWSASPSGLVELHCLAMRCSGGVQEWAPRAAELGLVPASAGRHATETHAGTADVPRSKPRETQADRDTQTLAPRPLVSGQDVAAQAASSGAIPREMLRI